MPAANSVAAASSASDVEAAATSCSPARASPPPFNRRSIASIPKAGSLLDSAGRVFGRGHPQYASYTADQFVSVKAQGAAGDGETDDTAAVQAVLARGLRTADIDEPGATRVGTAQMGDAVIAALAEAAGR